MKICFCLLTGIHLYNVPWRLRKVRDSNPRAISDSRVSGAVLSASQPTFLCFVYCARIWFSPPSSSHGVFFTHSTFIFSSMQYLPFTPFNAFSHRLHLSVIDSSSPSSCHTPHWQCSSQSQIVDMPSEYSLVPHSSPSS